MSLVVFYRGHLRQVRGCRSVARSERKVVLNSRVVLGIADLQTSNRRSIRHALKQKDYLPSTLLGKRKAYDSFGIQSVSLTRLNDTSKLSLSHARLLKIKVGHLPLEKIQITTGCEPVTLWQTSWLKIPTRQLKKLDYEQRAMDIFRRTVRTPGQTLMAFWKSGWTWHDWLLTLSILNLLK